jgi:WD40 repeat protein
VPAVSGHQGGVSNMSVSPDGKVLTTRGLDNTVRQWDMTTGKELRQFKVATAGNAVFSSDGKVLACGALNAVQLWDVDAGKELRSIAIQGQPQFGNMVAGSGGLALSADGKTLAVKGFDAAIRLYDTATGKELNPIQEQVADPNNKEAIFIASGAMYGSRPVLAFSPDSSLIATVGAPAVNNANGIVVGRPGMAGPGNMIRLWSVAMGKQVRQFETVQKGISALTFAPDGRTIITANSDNTISVWETVTGKECLVIKLKADAGAQQPNPAQPQQAFIAMQRGFGGTANTIAVSADGRSLAVGSEQTLRLFDLANGKELGEFKGHQGALMNVIFAADNQTVITGSADTTAVVWDGKRYIKKEQAANVQLEPKQLDDLWNDLSAEPLKGYQAVTALAAATKQVPAMFAERVKPTTGIDQKQLAQMIADLDSNKFDARQKATEDLEKLGEQAELALKKVLEGQPALETRQRVERLLERLVTNAAPPAEIVRGTRAVWVLEKIGTPEAREVLQNLAKGAPGDKLTRDAEVALKRLAK